MIQLCAHPDLLSNELVVVHELVVLLDHDREGVVVARPKFVRTFLLILSFAHEVVLD